MKYMHRISREGDHSEERTVGVKGCLELFRKFIRFGTVTRPSVVACFPSAKVDVGCVIWKSWLIAICAVDNTVQFMIKLEL